MENEIVKQTSERIISSGLLCAESCEAITKLGEELVDTWEKRQVFRTETEMRVSVLNDGKHPTKASKYWQAVREQASMLDNLAVVGFDYRRNEIAIERHGIALLNCVDELERAEVQIDLDECLYKKAAMQQSANDRMRELTLWSQLKAELDDGSFDTHDVNTHQLQSMVKSLRNREAALTPGSSQSEVINVLGPLGTALRMQGEGA